MPRRAPFVSHSGVWSLVGLAALGGWYATRLAVGEATPAVDDDDSLRRAMNAIHESRRLFVFSQWLMVVAQVATLVAVAIFLSRLKAEVEPHRRRFPDDEDEASRFWHTAAVACAGIWVTSGLVAAAARAALVRYDFSLFFDDERSSDEVVAELVFNVSDYVAAYGLATFAVAMALLGAITRAAGRDVDGVVVVTVTAVIAAAAGTIGAVGAAVVAVRDGRTGDHAAWRPGSGVGVVAIVGWMAVLLALIAAGWRDRADATVEASNSA